MFVTLLHHANGQLRLLLAACLQLARAFREWYLRPSTREQRGLKLLREWLSPEQLAQYDAHRYFDVIGCQTGKRYRIYHGNGTNAIELGDAAVPRTGRCFVPISDHLVAGDVMLAQKIALETDERGALASANNFNRDFGVSRLMTTPAKAPQLGFGLLDSLGDRRLQTLTRNRTSMVEQSFCGSTYG